MNPDIFTPHAYCAHDEMQMTNTCKYNLLVLRSVLISQDNNNSNNLGNRGEGEASMPVGTGHGCNGDHQRPGVRRLCAIGPRTKMISHDSGVWWTESKDGVIALRLILARDGKATATSTPSPTGMHYRGNSGGQLSHTYEPILFASCFPLP